MNSASQNPEQAIGARKVQIRAAEWVNQRRDSGIWSEEDQTALDAWLAQSPANRVAYWRLDAAWERSQRLSALHPLPREKSPVVLRRHLPLFLKIAATIAVAAAGVGTIYFQNSHAERQFATAIGTREILTLADGTHIELNTNTALHVSADQQTVRLDRGEAYFDVKHDATRKFVVIANGHRIIDLGTKFAIRTDENRLRVAMVEGQVRLDVPKDQKDASLLLTTGDVAIANGDALTITQQPAEELARELSWRQGMLVFNNTTLADAVAEFNRYNHVKLVIADQSIAQLKIDGTFPENDTALFTRAAQQLFRLRVGQRGQVTVISR
jgi:transmembrane sensor